ncbi:hypothetical protein P8452_58244 [Trifolium repens]|nr:hypothetical protein P8452_58244 [Trifolium repens]
MVVVRVDLKRGMLMEEERDKRGVNLQCCWKKKERRGAKEMEALKLSAAISDRSSIHATPVSETAVKPSFLSSHLLVSNRFSSSVLQKINQGKRLIATSPSQIHDKGKLEIL